MSRCVNAATKWLLGGAWALALFVTPHCAQATAFKVLYSFTGGSGGGNPDYGSLIMSGNGNLYGTGAQPLGTGSVYELFPNGNLSILYYFPGGSGGAGPEALVMDKRGNLWGSACCGGIGGGVIFKINSSGKEKLVHTFMGQPNDGCSPDAAMIMDANGNFFGTAKGCAKYNGGAVFELAPDGNEKLVHSFNQRRSGFIPFAGLIIDSDQDLYGVNGAGGSKDFGTVFEIAASGSEILLHTFKGSPNDGSTPDGTLIMDQSGNLYGTTQGGGRTGCFDDSGCGTIFKLESDGTEKILHYFEGARADGANPVAGVIADSSGNFYGTTEFGGGNAACNGDIGCGTVFEIAPDGTETILHSFGDGSKGANPVAGLVADGKGNFYGTAINGGSYGYGTVFEITP